MDTPGFDQDWRMGTTTTVLLFLYALVYDTDNLGKKSHVLAQVGSGSVEDRSTLY